MVLSDIALIAESTLTDNLSLCYWRGSLGSNYKSLNCCGGDIYHNRLLDNDQNSQIWNSQIGALPVYLT